jgi:hypothetical protein
VITVTRCNNLSCNSTNLTVVGSAQVAADGGFVLTLLLQEVKGARLLFAVTILDLGMGSASGLEQQITYRAIAFLTAAQERLDVPIDPISEAALRLLSEGGLENFSLGAIQTAVGAVRTANAATSFADETAEAAVDSAVQIARQDPEAQHALASARPFCLGDCNDDGAVTVDEILVLVNIALGRTDLVGCIAGNRNADVEITVDEILAAVNSALSGCPL